MKAMLTVDDTESYSDQSGSPPGQWLRMITSVYIEEASLCMTRFSAIYSHDQSHLPSSEAAKRCPVIFLEGPQTLP